MKLCIFPPIILQPGWQFVPAELPEKFERRKIAVFMAYYPVFSQDFLSGP
jgi:hypothetical protein